MAKRGYRGKHPHNDMNVSKHSQGGKAHPKLKKQYDGLKPKQKYGFIRDHEGFFPQASVTISGTENLVAASEISMSAHNGELVYMSGVDGANNTGNKVFKANGTHLQASTGIVAIVNASTNLSAVLSGNDAVITSKVSGPDGNTEIILPAVNVLSSVTFNGTAASSSGSLYMTGG